VNSGLEQEFENVLGKKNKNCTEVGQIISAINNIYKVVEMIAEDRNQKTKLLREFKDSDYITYEDENPDKVVTKSNESSNILQMTKKLDKAIEFITDLVAVNDQLKKSKKKKL
jgi:hypothetical protein